MRERKYCQCCGVFISDINAEGTDYYRHIRIKYCDSCREMMNQFQNRNRQKDFRQRQKQIKKLREEKIQLLAEENEVLRLRVIQLRNELENNKQ